MKEAAAAAASNPFSLSLKKIVGSILGGRLNVIYDNVGVFLSVDIKDLCSIKTWERHRNLLEN